MKPQLLLETLHPWHIARRWLIAALLTLVLLIGLVAVHAQDTNNVPPATPQSFFGTVQQYFTSANTNFDLSQGKAELWTSMAYQSGLNFAADLGLRYRLSKPGAASGFAVESVTRNASIAGTIVSQQVGVSYCLYNHDIEISGGIDGGYDFQKSSGLFTVFLDARKALTENTFAGLRLGYETDLKNAKAEPPVLSVIVGFKF